LNSDISLSSRAGSREMPLSCEPIWFTSTSLALGLIEPLEKFEVAFYDSTQKTYLFATTFVVNELQGLWSRHKRRSHTLALGFKRCNRIVKDQTKKTTDFRRSSNLPLMRPCQKGFIVERPNHGLSPRLEKVH
jgi:hypothetical protein